MNSHYLNTDLCLVSGTDLSPLVSALGENAEVLICGPQADGKWYATIEARGSGEAGRTPQQDTDSLVAAVEALNEDGAARFVACERKEMNIGWQSSASRPEGAFAVDSATLGRLAERDIVLSVTVYPSSENDL